jgi:MYXO-CTERM domain-containing protein
VQLWHGNADMTVNYNNQLEAIKEWTTVLGLSPTPTSTTMLTFNSHQWTREIWQDSCGFTLLDAFTEQGGPHNTDASEDATYVVPFLDLDETGPVDPQVSETCARDGGSSDATADVGPPGSGDAGDASSKTADSGGSGPEGSSSSSSVAGSLRAGSSSAGSNSARSSSSSGTSSASNGSTATGGSGGLPTSSGCSCHVVPGGGQAPTGGFPLAVVVGLLCRRRRRALARGPASHPDSSLRSAE